MASNPLFNWLTIEGYSMFSEVPFDGSPLKKGGKDNLGNLRPLQTDENKDKGKEYPWKP